MKKKILFITACFICGGRSNITFRLARELRNQGYDITVIVKEGRGILKKGDREILNIIDLNRAGWRNYLFMLKDIISFLRRNHPDIIFCNSPIFSAISFIALKLLRLKVRTYEVEHSMFSFTLSPKDSSHCLLVNYLRGKFIYLVSKVIYPKLERIITVSDAVREEILREYKLVPSNKIIRIYNPVVELGHCHFERCEAKETRKKIILGCGRLSPEKGFLFLIQAFAILSEKYADLKLVIIGDGEQSQELEKLITELNINDKVSLPGYQSDPFQWYRQADVFVLSSLSEAFALVLVEAMSCGVTPVSTHLPGPMEIIDGGRFGYVVPVGDVDKMAEGIERALQNPIDAKILRERASCFSVENSIKQYVDLIEKDFKKKTG